MMSRSSCSAWKAFGLVAADVDDLVVVAERDQELRIGRVDVGRDRSRGSARRRRGSRRSRRPRGRRRPTSASRAWPIPNRDRAARPRRTAGRPRAGGPSSSSLLGAEIDLLRASDSRSGSRRGAGEPAPDRAMRAAEPPQRRGPEPSDGGKRLTTTCHTPHSHAFPQPSVPGAALPAPGRDRVSTGSGGVETKSAARARAAPDACRRPASAGAAQVRRADARAGQLRGRLGVERHPSQASGVREEPRSSRLVSAMAGAHARVARRGSARPPSARSPSASSILWRTDSSGRRRPPGVSTRVAVDDDGVVERAAEREPVAPASSRRRPAGRRCGSRRARARRRRWPSSARLACWPIAASGKSMSKSIDSVSAGRQLGHDVALRPRGPASGPGSPCSGASLRREAGAAGSPGRSAAALPSMIGTSGPSISTRAWVTPVPASAAIRCSTVPRPRRRPRSTSRVQSVVSVDPVPARRDDVVAVGDVHPAEADAALGRRPQDQPRRAAGMEAHPDKRRSRASRSSAWSPPASALAVSPASCLVHRI